MAKRFMSTEHAIPILSEIKTKEVQVQDELLLLKKQIRRQRWIEAIRKHKAKKEAQQYEEITG